MTNVCFFKKTSVFSITYEVNVKVNNGLIRGCNLLIYYFWLIWTYSSPVNVGFRIFLILKEVKKNKKINQLLNRQCWPRGASAHQTLSTNYSSPFFMSLLWLTLFDKHSSGQAGGPCVKLRPARITTQDYIAAQVRLTPQIQIHWSKSPIR